MTQSKVIVGMSGGVDSSVAALLLIEQGYQVEGLFMKNWEEDDTDTHCSAAQDVQDAATVCELLGIPLHTVNFSAEYWDAVFEDFLKEHRAGRTPNPDILCNREIKFKAFLEYATELGADFIATGHYAKKTTRAGQHQLCKAADLNKDQTYFLYTLHQYQLSRTLFPLTDLKKTDIRQIAERAGFQNHKKKDSTGICFIGERKFKDFLKRFLPTEPGEIISVEGVRLGQHDGLMYHTIGQRQGLKIGGQAHSTGEPWYVVEKRLEDNTLIVAQGAEHPKLYLQQLLAEQCHWIAGEAPSVEKPYQAKIRYRQNDQACQIRFTGPASCEVVFIEPQRAITPGQSIVFYEGDVCLGGGIISHIPIPSSHLGKSIRPLTHSQQEVQHHEKQEAEYGDL